MNCDDVKKLYETRAQVQGILYRPWTDRFRFVTLEWDDGWKGLTRIAAEAVEVDVTNHDDDDDLIVESCVGMCEATSKYICLFNNCDEFLEEWNPRSRCAAQWGFWDNDDCALFGPCLFLRSDGEDCHIEDMVKLASMKLAVIDEEEADLG